MDTKKILDLAVHAVIGSQPGLIIRIRPATKFELKTWVNCLDDGLRILIDEDGTKEQNLELSAELPNATFVSAEEWRKLLNRELKKIK